MFAAAQRLRDASQNQVSPETIIGELVSTIRFGDTSMELLLNTQALDHKTSESLSWSIPLPSRKPFRETKLQIDEESDSRKPNQQLVQIPVEAMKVQALMLASPELSLSQFGKREGRCRKHMTKLLRLSWLSPRIVGAILSGEQSRQITRARLLNSELPLEWSDQQRLLGFPR